LSWIVTVHSATPTTIHQVLRDFRLFAYHSAMSNTAMSNPSPNPSLPNLPAPRLILASGSQRRQQFLRELGLAFTIIVADIDETPLPAEQPGAMTWRLAEEKARAVALRLHGNHAALPPAEETGSAPGGATLIIASDTTVALGNVIYGKPADAADARRMLRDLRARDHQVISAVSVLHLPSDRQATRINTTTVQMRPYSDAEIDAYVQSGDPLDKAGAYGIQARAFNPVARLAGCYAGVMGLPLADLADLLREFGVTVTASIPAVCGLFNTFACCAANPSHTAAIAFTP
jgi:septum formation protein